MTLALVYARPLNKKLRSKPRSPFVTPEGRTKNPSAAPKSHFLIFFPKTSLMPPSDCDSIASVESYHHQFVGDETTTVFSFVDDDTERDEVKEIRKLSSRDTNRIRLWRVVVTLVLLGTAVSVTFATYRLLLTKQDRIFEEAVSARQARRIYCQSHEPLTFHARLLRSTVSSRLL